MSEIPEYIVTDGWSKGESWFVAVRRPTGSLRRVCSPMLPVRSTRAEVLADLDRWLAFRIYGDVRTTAAQREPLGRQLKRLRGETA